MTPGPERYGDDDLLGEFYPLDNEEYLQAEGSPAGIAVIWPTEQSAAHALDRAIITFGHPSDEPTSSSVVLNEPISQDDDGYGEGSGLEIAALVHERSDAVDAVSLVFGNLTFSWHAPAPKFPHSERELGECAVLLSAASPSAAPRELEGLIVATATDVVAKNVHQLLPHLDLLR